MKAATASASAIRGVKASKSRSVTRDLTVGKPMGLIISFTLPLLFGVLFQQLYSFVDTAIVGRYLGAAKLAAVGATGSVNFLVNGLCMGFCSGFAIPIAQAFGAKDEKSLRRAVSHSVYLCTVMSIAMAVLTALACPLLLRWMNTPEEIMPGAVSYIRIIFMAIPCTVLYNMAAGILRSLGDSRTPVVFLVVASLINIVLDLALILGAKLDVAGAAIATAVSQLVSGIGCVWGMVRRFPILHLNEEDRRFDPKLAKSLIGIGLPMGLQFSITAIGSVLVQWSVNGLGVNAVAAVSSAGKLSMFFCCVFDALATTMATFAGQNMGARKLNRVGEGLKVMALIGTAYCLLALGAIVLLRRPLLGLFINSQTDAEVMELGSQFLLINGAFYIPLLFVNIVRLCIQGMGFTKAAMLAGVCEMAARAAVALLLVPLMGFTGACLANPAAWIMADLFLFPCYFHIMKNLKYRLG